MELQQLRYVLAVAETRNFTRAAEQCFVVQSALSHQVKALEQELGTALFARTSRRVELTAAGAAFLPAARTSLEAADRAAADAAATIGQVRGTLTMGLIPTVTAVDVPGALGAFHRAYPAVRISVRSGSSDELMTAIHRGEVDVAVLGLPESTRPAGVESREVARERLVAVLAGGHRLARRRRLHLTDLAKETFADFPAGTPGRAQSDLAFDAAGILRDVTFEATSTDLIIALVQQGLAVALLPAAFVPSDPRVVTVTVADGPTRVEYLAWSSFNPSPATTAFLDRLLTSGAAGPREA
ncbi:LysR family transcriptional regulator [Nocardioides marinus]|uniref:DNA-binding transcriptional LysR family regulator n=1 Tax=Nocardioides marinus TaxID=374514 RepID=A0A7Z0C1I4_9ACTN|nr:LysR family transcriptional regulator [Nocardioides marinus]NYI09850.1 DNA-binding transcriptional LysR family regulator [Nocardioides marinus]